MDDFLKCNYHTHTMRCRHAQNTEREYIEAAIEMGIEVLGFADHIPCPFKTGYVSPIRILMEEAPGYVAAIKELAKEYEGRIRLLVGFEAEYMPEFYDEQMALFNELKMDYMIMGQHWIASEEIEMYEGVPMEDGERLRRYVDSVIAGMETGSYAYLAHPDLIYYEGKDSYYEQQMGRLCEAMKEMDIPLEINLLGISQHKHYPSERFWKIVGEVGNKVILGLDAHKAEQVKDRDAYVKAMELVERHGLNLIQGLKI
ncbi:MAG: histidinol-phosphatase [Clostridiales bacterium]|nr:histidinol-phosphatase [Clostridiales bacterium]